MYTIRKLQRFIIIAVGKRYKITAVAQAGSPPDHTFERVVLRAIEYIIAQLTIKM